MSAAEGSWWGLAAGPVSRTSLGYRCMLCALLTLPWALGKPSCSWRSVKGRAGFSAEKVKRELVCFPGVEGYKDLGLGGARSPCAAAGRSPR